MIQMAVIIFVFGLIFGSFINALVWRIKKKKNWVNERSICPNCKKELKPQHLVPVFSWLWQRGKCAYCKKPIPGSYPAVELFTGVVFVISYLSWPSDFSGIEIFAFVLWLIICVILVALLVYDLQTKILPDGLVLSLTFVSVVFVLFQAYTSKDWGLLVSSAVGALVLSGIFWGLFQVSGGKWIGGGDVKIAVSLGLLAGSAVSSMLLLFIASLLGSFIGVPLMLAKKAGMKTELPFGPFLIIATFIVFFYGDSLINWYLGLLYI